MFVYELRIGQITNNTYCLVYTQEFNSNENLKDYTYWIKNMYICIEKIKTNDIKITKRKSKTNTNK